ncbi:MAG TPA: amino acid-binding protein [Ruminococcaceae bacterium]|nr:amino acid-binding protein [Oscillospiraceae bacterium]HAY72315.1 amino acid-binding protein [Oscillospiraceae bacterium]HCT16077.1 amino acid-binding protein [Oscillospiraceae bacterium]
MAITQISVFLENRAGQLSEITKILSDNNIDLKALNIAETADYGILRIISDDCNEAAKLLRNNGFIVTETPVVAAAVPNKAGGLNELLNIISNEDIDIEYMYSVFGQKDGLAYMIFKVKDVDIFTSVLKKYFVVVANENDLGIK